MVKYEPTAMSVIAMTSVSLGLSFLAVVLRFISRGIVLKRINLEDWLIAVAWLLSFAITFTICLGITYGLGTPNISDENVIPERKTRYVYTLLYQPALMVTKTSILWFYLSISQNFRLVRWGNWATLFVVNVAGIILTFLVAFQCNPVSATFLKVMPPGTKCIETYALIYISAPINVITDLAILILPMPVLTSLRLPSKQKIILIMVFAGGGLTSIIGIIRIYYFQKTLTRDSNSGYGGTANENTYTWDGALSFMWSSVEINAGIICASIPMIKPLIAEFWPSCIGMGRSAGSRDTVNSSTQDSAEFITFESPKSAIALSWKESLKPLCLVTILFFLWGFSHGFVNTCNSKFEGLLGISAAESVGLHAAYFGGYFVAPLLFSGFSLKTYGFKVTFIIGLCIDGCGCLIFWPSAVLQSYSGFCLSMVVVGSGLATLEVAANSFVILCGPAQFGEARVNVSQGFQAIGATVGPIVATLVLPSYAVGETSLRNVQWVYLGNSFFVFLLAIAYYYSSIPEVKDTDFPTGPERHAPKALWKSKYSIGLAWAISAQFFYTGAQEIISEFSGIFLDQGTPEIYRSSNINHGLFAAGRFAASIGMLVFRPRWILLLALGVCTICATLAMTSTDKRIELIMVRLMFFFEATVFPTVFATAIHGLGRHTKDGAKYVVSSAVGAAIFPAVYLSVLQQSNPGRAMSVTIAIYGAALTYPIYLCISPRERERLDKLRHLGAVVKDRPVSIALQDTKSGRRQYVEVV